MNDLRLLHLIAYEFNLNLSYNERIKIYVDSRPDTKELYLKVLRYIRDCLLYARAGELFVPKKVGDWIRYARDCNNSVELCFINFDNNCRVILKLRLMRKTRLRTCSLFNLIDSMITNLEVV